MTLSFLFNTKHCTDDKRRGGAPAPLQTSTAAFKDVAVIQISPGGHLTCLPKLFKPYSLVQAQKIRSRAEEGGRQVLTKLLINPIAL